MFERLKYTFLYDLINPFFQRVEVISWVGRGKTPPTPQLVKRELIAEYANKYSLKVFVETGTYLGVMIGCLKSAFDKIYTIEIDKKLCDRAKAKLRKYKHVSVFYGDSSNVLSPVLSKIDSPCLFWLDAHFSGGITGKGESMTPVLEELKLILKHRIKKHIILIDDANLFNGRNGYPSVKEVRDKFLQRKNKYQLSILNNIIILVPKIKA